MLSTPACSFVENQHVSGLLLVRILRVVDYACVTHNSNLADLCRLHLKNRYDLLLMPGMDGFDPAFGEAAAIARRMRTSLSGQPPFPD